MNSHDNLFPVGIYNSLFNKILSITLPCGKIYQSGGLHKNISNRHPDCLKYLNSIPDIIDSPDYIGINPHEAKSIELVKKYDSNILVGIKLDLSKNYLYVASLYEISDAKVNRRLHGGRLKPFKKC